jgi:SPP1 gp7 family putative phage head morphogenesis protein
MTSFKKMSSLNEIVCCDSQPNDFHIPPESENNLLNLFLKCISDFFKGILTLENWNDNKKAKKLREIITNSLLNAVDIGYKEGKNNLNLAYNAKDLELLKRINDNIYTFAAYKNYQTIKELGNYLKDTNGDIRSFADFRKAVLQDVHTKYNLQWLEAEYNTTYAQAQNASRWVGFEANKDLFSMLKYNTQLDANVSDEHKILHGIVAHIDDPIWDRISPVRRIQCRCYLTSHQASEVTVTKVLPDIPNLPKNSPFSGGNVGKTGVVFGENHPYFDVSSEDKERIKKVINR